MQVTKQQIIDGIFAYGDNEIMPHIDVKMVKQIVGAALIAIKIEPNIVNRFMENPIVSSALQEKDGVYDLDFAEKVLCETVKTYGPIEFIPNIPKFILGGAENKTFRFGEEDIKKLKSFIEKGQA